MRYRYFVQDQPNELMRPVGENNDVSAGDKLKFTHRQESGYIKFFVVCDLLGKPQLIYQGHAVFGERFYEGIVRENGMLEELKRHN